MTFSLHESIGPDEAFDCVASSFHSLPFDGETLKQDMHILQEKLRIPEIPNHVVRLRIESLLARSVSQYPATLISGRAGTGKTTLAAAFARSFSNVSWFSVESTDSSWATFSRYFSACMPSPKNGKGPEISNPEHDTEPGDIARFLVKNFSGIYATPGSGTTLIVLDDIHHIFDAVWFEDFFNLLLYSLPPSTHLLMLCRSKPPSPLWRLRSKQMLNVIDEKVIAFNLEETEALIRSLSLNPLLATDAHRLSFGRVSKILQIAESDFPTLPSSPI